MIKGLSETRRLPRLGKIFLGIKKISEKTGKEYPAAVDYFVCPDEVKAIYGEKPKELKIMFPIENEQIFFQQFYKRYGSGTLLQCKGNAEVADCIDEEYAKDLKILGPSDFGPFIKVECLGEECPYRKTKACNHIGIFQFLLPEIPGAGVYQITTGSVNSIININSSIDFIRAICGRIRMIPLTLKIAPQEVAPGGKKKIVYTLSIDFGANIRLADLQKVALIAPEKILLPPPDESRDELLYPEAENGTDNKNGGEKENGEIAISSKPKSPVNGPAVEKAKEIFRGKVIVDLKAFEDVSHFDKKDHAKAASMLGQLKKCYEKLGEERFLYCLGNSGWESLQQITKISNLANLVNVCLSEVKSKESE